MGIKHLQLGYLEGSQGGTVVTNPLASAGDTRDTGSIPGSGRASGEGNGNPLQYSCRENPMNGGAWQATVCGVAKSQTRLSNFTTRKGSLKFIIIATVELLYEL